MLGQGKGGGLEEEEGQEGAIRHIGNKVTEITCNDADVGKGRLRERGVENVSFQLTPFVYKPMAELIFQKPFITIIMGKLSSCQVFRQPKYILWVSV